jgi:hypothetical protein
MWLLWMGAFRAGGVAPPVSSLPTKADLLTMDYAYQAQPFVNVEAKALNTLTLDYAYQAQPFVGAAG